MKRLHIIVFHFKIDEVRYGDLFLVHRTLRKLEATSVLVTSPAKILVGSLAKKKTCMKILCTGIQKPQCQSKISENAEEITRIIYPTTM